MNEADKAKIPCSVLILSFNNEATIERALQSVADFDEVIVCDGGSTDATRDIAARYGARLMDQPLEYKDVDGRIKDFSGVRNHVYRQIRNPWFLFVDSDEYLSTELRDEIRAITRTEQEGVYTLFRTYVLPDGRPVDCATTYPNPSVRFCATRSSDGFVKPIHERIEPHAGAPLRILKGTLYVPIGGVSGPGRAKGDRYIAIEVSRAVLGGQPFWRVFMRVLVRHVLVSFRYALRHIRILLFCRGVRMPFAVEWERHVYHARLIHAFWSRRKEFKRKV